jgi:radical SAM superfamily enzyme YgiQ (UPF0313 family)
VKAENGADRTRAARKRVLLVYPHFRIYPYAISKADEPSTPCLTLAVLSGVARKEGAITCACDLYGRLEPMKVFREYLKNFKPDLVAITFNTPQAEQALELAAEAKKFDPSLMTVGGGVHATAMPGDVLLNGSFDVLITGEGELPFARLLAGEDPSAIPGAACLREGRVVINPPPALIQDLDSLTMPDYECFDLSYYRVRKRLWKNARIAGIETSRGCPHSCSYCVSNLVFGNRLRVKSPERVVEEFERTARLGFREVLIQDDDFTLDRDRAARIFEMLIARNIRMDIELSNGVRADKLTRDFLKTARRAGCYRIRIGIESGSTEVLKNVDKNIDLERMRRVISDARSMGIEVIALLVLGFPGETRETFLKTLEFARACGADMARMAMFTPYPGSRIYDEWKAEGRLLPASFSDYLIYQVDKPLYRHPVMSHEELVKCYDEFYRGFYLRPGYILRQFWIWLVRGRLADYTLYFLGKFFR